MLVPLELDNPIVEELENEAASMESRERDMQRLKDIAKRISMEGMSSSIASSVNLICPDALDKINPKSFTLRNSKVNVVPSIEGIGTSTWNILKSVTSAILKFIARALEWLVENGYSDKTNEDLRKKAASYEKVDEYNRELKAKLEEAIARGDAATELATSYRDIITGQHPELAEIRQLALSSYTVLVRSSLLNMADTEKLLGYADTVGTLDHTFNGIANTFISVITRIEEDAPWEEIQAAIEISVTLYETFQAALTPIAEKLASLRLQGIRMPKVDRTRPEAFFAEFRSELMKAAMTPSGYLITDDLPNLKDRTGRIVEISKLSDKVIKEFAKRKSDHVKLTKAVGRLRKMAESRNFGKSRIVENSDLVKKDILLINRRLRSVILSVMRLREIPEVYSKAHRQFIGRQGKELVLQASMLKEL